MTKRHLLIYFFTLIICHCMQGQEIVKLWEGNPPTTNGVKEKEVAENNLRWIYNVSSPELHIYPATNPNKMAVIICPGGGYSGLAFSHEGTEFAKWLNLKGITAAILKYRMPNGHKEIPLDDAWQAMRYMRKSAQKYNIDTNKIGIAGFSAGGHLASTASTHFDEKEGISTRPDFSILFYPVITMGENTHQGSKDCLLGTRPSDADVQAYSNEKWVSADTPPTILLLSDDDKTVVPENSIAYYAALKKNSIPASMYIFPEGGHGWGMNVNFKYHTQFLNLLQNWLEERNEK